MRKTTHDFCCSFAAGTPGEKCLDQFFTASPAILEHGPVWASQKLPFLATKFQGRRVKSLEKNPTETEMTQESKTTCDDYYELLTSVLSYDPSSVFVPQEQEIAVDPLAGIATVKLHARFQSVETGKAWNEDFVYVLSEFDQNGRIGRHELWADPLSAWMAVSAEGEGLVESST